MFSAATSDRGAPVLLGEGYWKIMPSEFILNKLCMVASSDWGQPVYSPQFVYKARSLSKTLHTLYYLARCERIPVWGLGWGGVWTFEGLFHTHLKGIGRLVCISCLLGLFSWKELVEEELTQRTLLEERCLTHSGEKEVPAEVWSWNV